MIILGIDPSLNGTGLAVIDTGGRRGDEKVLATQRVKTDENATLQYRIAQVAFVAANLADAYAPSVAKGATR